MLRFIHSEKSNDERFLNNFSGKNFDHKEFVKQKILFYFLSGNNASPLVSQLIPNEINAKNSNQKIGL